MLPYILIAAGLGLLLTMVMYMRLAKRQEDVQKGLLDATAANDEAMRAVRQKADAAESAVKDTAEHLESSLAAQEPALADVRARIEGVETRFARFENTVESTARRANELEERSKRAGDDVQRSVEALREEAQTLGAAVQTLRNTSDKRLAELAARVEKVERSLGMGQSSKSKKKPKPPASKARASSQADEAERDAPRSNVISAMAAPSVMAAQKAARKAATGGAAATAAASAPVPAADDDEIDEGSARWIFVVLGLMLALAVIANVVSR